MKNILIVAAMITLAIGFKVYLDHSERQRFDESWSDGYAYPVGVRQDGHKLVIYVIGTDSVIVGRPDMLKKGGMSMETFERSVQRVRIGHFTSTFRFYNYFDQPILTVSESYDGGMYLLSLRELQERRKTMANR